MPHEQKSKVCKKKGLCFGCQGKGHFFKNCPVASKACPVLLLEKSVPGKKSSSGRSAIVRSNEAVRRCELAGLESVAS